MLKVIPLKDSALQSADLAEQARLENHVISRTEIERVVEAVDANVSLAHVGLGSDSPLDASDLPVVAQPIVQSIRLPSVLSLVAAANYMRFGPRGVPRYGPASNPVSATQVNPDALSVMISLCDQSGETLLGISDVVLRKIWTGREQVTWAGYLPQYGLQVVWVWDFYRILSFIGLNAQLGPALTVEQESLQTVLEQLSDGDNLRISVPLPTGDMVQQFQITNESLAGRDNRHAEQG